MNPLVGPDLARPTDRNAFPDDLAISMIRLDEDAPRLFSQSVRDMKVGFIIGRAAAANGSK